MLLVVQQNLGFAWGNVSTVTVPNVVGETQAQGTTDIQAVGLTVGITTAYSNTVAAGLIISQNPVGGTQVSPGSNVDIVVSLGPQPAGSNPAQPAGGRDSWSPKFEFSKRKVEDKADPEKQENKTITRKSQAKANPALAKTLSVDLLSKLDDDDEAIAAVIEYESQMIAQFLARLQ